MRKKRILLCVYHFIASDIADFFHSQGWEVELLGYYENDDFTKVWRHDTQQILQQIAAGADLFFTLNSQHLDRRVTRLLRSQNIPLINWFLDDPFSSISPWYIDNGTLQPSPQLQLWCIDRSQSDKLRQRGYNAKYVPHITTERFFNATPSEPARNTGFIGNLGFSLRQSYSTFLGDDHRALQWSYDLIRDFIARDRRDFESFLDNYSPAPAPFSFRCDTPQGQQQRDFLKFLTSAHTRRALGEALPTEGLTIYGDEDWLEFIDPQNFGGRISYHDATPTIYASTKININITHLQFGDAFNQRILDVLAGGNFLLTDYTPALDDYFEVGRDIICYKKRSEIPALIDHYLHHDDQRHAVAERGQAIVKRHFSLAARFEQLLNEIATQD